MKDCHICQQTEENCECHISKEKERIDFIKMINENVSYKEEDLLSIMYDKINDAKQESRRFGFIVGVLVGILFIFGGILLRSPDTFYVTIGVIFTLISIFIMSYGFKKKKDEN
tara:strand:- start:2157 stop:2495 length:339 start_codon:yes stop_codon:yes gene_type:complete